MSGSGLRRRRRVKAKGKAVTEKGRVRAIQEGRVTVVTDCEAACFGCMKTECKGKAGFIEAENSFSLPLEIGQEVEVTARTASLFNQALIALMPPVLSFTLGYLLTRFLFPGTGEGVAAFAGIFFLFLAALIVYAVTGKKNKTELFIVTRIIG